MVRVKVGVPTKHGFIDPGRMKCEGCGEEFNYPYYDWAGGPYVIASAQNVGNQLRSTIKRVKGNG